MKSIFFLSFFLFFSFHLYAQNVTISGYIADEQGETLVGANVYQSRSAGCVSNGYGFYTLSVPRGQVNLYFSYVGFASDSAKLYVSKDTTIHITLKAVSFEEVVVNASKIDFPATNVVSVPIQQIKLIPNIAGEADIMKSLSFTPGVSNGAEGSAGLYVRGGTPDQNLILLDDAVVYNPNHLFGFLSVFNTDAIKSVSLIKGGFPARYGGRLSSVVDVRMKEGNTKKIQGDFGIGLLASRFTIEGPIIKDKLSFIVSARSAYLTLLTLPMRLSYNSGRDLSRQFVNFNMYDTNAKLNYKINDKNQLFLSFYKGNDKLTADENTFGFEENSDLGWGNTTATIRWNRQIGGKIFWKNIVAYSKFDYQLNNRTTVPYFIPDSLRNDTVDYPSSVSSSGTSSNLQNITVKSIVDFTPNAKHSFHFGLEATKHWFVPQESFSYNGDTLVNGLSENITAHEVSIFVEDEWRISPDLTANIGIRNNNYFVNGKRYSSFEPRISLNYNLPAQFLLQVSYSRMQQNIHLLTNSGVGLQNDIWVPSTDKIRPQKSEQVSVQVSRYLPRLDITFSLEGYYKKMANLVMYSEGVDPILSFDKVWSKKVETDGEGISYGLEFFAHKKVGKFNGMLAYTLSKTELQFTNINLGLPFPFKYDFTHNLAFTASYQATQKWNFALSWVYRTGQATNYPIAAYNLPPISDISNGTFSGFVYLPRNSVRFPDYHRLDVGANHSKTTKRGNVRTWSFSVYNAYYRRNIFYIEFGNKYVYESGSFRPIAIRPAIQARAFLPILPSISYSFRF